MAPPMGDTKGVAAGAAAAAGDAAAGQGAGGNRKRQRAPIDPEVYLARGQVEKYKRALLTYSRRTPGSVTFIEPVVVPVKSGSGMGGHRGGAAQVGKAWDLRELCKKLKPLAPWDNVEPHTSFKLLPALNIDFLAHADPRVRSEALQDLVWLNRELLQFFRDNPLNSAKGSSKPPQRHRANQTLLGEAEYRAPFLQFFVPGPQPLGVTDVGQVTLGVEREEGVPDIPAPQRAEVEECLQHLDQFQSDRHNLRLFVGLLGEQVQYPPLSCDLFTRMHDGQTDRAREGTAATKNALCYVDGVSGPLPTQYIEKSGVQPPNDKAKNPPQRNKNKNKNKQQQQQQKQQQGKEEEEDEEEEGWEYDPAEEARLWFTRTHNEFGLLTFLNYMHASGRAEEGAMDVLAKDAEAVLEARRRREGFKLWLFVLNDEGENMRRADQYARSVHGFDSWHQLVDWAESGQHDFRVRAKDLLDHGVDVALTVQQPGQLVVGGPGTAHGVVQQGTSFAVAVNLCHLDLLHMAVRMQKGGDLHEGRGNRKTVGAKPWFKISADSALSILRSLELDLRRIVAGDCPAVDKKRRLRRLEGDKDQLRTSLEQIEESMVKQGPDSAYSKALIKQGWIAVHEGPFRRLEEALDSALAGNSAEEVKALLAEPAAAAAAAAAEGEEEQQQESASPVLAPPLPVLVPPPPSLSAHAPVKEFGAGSPWYEPDSADEKEEGGSEWKEQHVGEKKEAAAAAMLVAPMELSSRVPSLLRQPQPTGPGVDAATVTH